MATSHTPTDTPHSPDDSAHDIVSTSPVTPLGTDPGALPADLQDERLISERGLAGWAAASWSRVRTGDLGSLPVVIGLVVIWAVFQSLNSNFLSSQNLVNLTLQSAAVGTIAIGVVLVLLLGQIDLSVGSISGLSSAVLVVGFVNQGWSAPVAVVAALASGLLIGLVYGAIFTTFGVPSFVITLAGLLGFLGLQLLVLGDEGTVNLPFDSGLVAFAQQTFLLEPTSYAVVGAVVVVYAATRLRASSLRRDAGLSAPSATATIVRALLLAVVLLVPTYVLNRDRGVPMMFLTFVVLVVVMDLALRRTRWGRSVMAVGGSVEAARRAGIRVRGIYLSVFALTATFAALGGIFAACRLAAANQSSGGADTNLNAIAAAVIGGTSLFGGRGSAYSALLGVIVIQSISSGLSLLNLDSSVRYMVTGGVLLLAVVIDSLSRRSRAAHGRA